MNPNQPLFDHNAIFTYYAAGHSLPDCQQYFGCSYRTAKRAVLKHGKLRTNKEGVNLKNSQRTFTHSLEARQRMSLAAIKRAQGKVRTPHYRVRRSNHIHPVLSCQEKTWHRWLIAQADYTCAVTRERGCKLAVHHLYSVKSYPEKRWDDSNVIVIKKTLHDEFHQRFMGGSQRPCTPDDWERFLQQ
jgi:nitrous oxidase accessory protein NosD